MVMVRAPVSELAASHARLGCFQIVDFVIIHAIRATGTFVRGRIVVTLTLVPVGAVMVSMVLFPMVGSSMGVCKSVTSASSFLGGGHPHQANWKPRWPSIRKLGFGAGRALCPVPLQA